MWPHVLLSWLPHTALLCSINYDQTLVASHGLLGFSGCGTNLMLLLGDVDEFLHTASGKPWPHPDVLTCLQVRGFGGEGSQVHWVARRGGVGKDP